MSRERSGIFASRWPEELYYIPDLWKLAVPKTPYDYDKITLHRLNNQTSPCPIRVYSIPRNDYQAQAFIDSSINLFTGS